MDDLLSIIRRVGDLVPSLENLVFGLCWVIGLLLMVASVRAAMRTASEAGGRQSWSGPIVKAVLGTAFIALPTTIATLVTSFFGSPDIADPREALAYAPNMLSVFEGDQAKQTIAALLTIVQLVGLIGFCRGLLLLNALTNGSPNASLGAGLAHVFGGTLAINITALLGVFDSLLAP
jgi:hypothetical protein